MVRVCWCGYGFSGLGSGGDSGERICGLAWDSFDVVRRTSCSQRRLCPTISKPFRFNGSMSSQSITYTSRAPWLISCRIAGTISLLAIYEVTPAIFEGLVRWRSCLLCWLDTDNTYKELVLLVTRTR